MGSSVMGCSDHDLLFSHEEVVESTPEEQRFVDDKVSHTQTTNNFSVILKTAREI